MTNLHTKMENYRNGYSYYKKLEDEVVCGRMSGQAGNVYRAGTIVGLCEKAEEPELGEVFWPTEEGAKEVERKMAIAMEE